MEEVESVIPNVGCSCNAQMRFDFSSWKRFVFFDQMFWFYCSWWQHAANLASYEQQDAHEFFISMLDGIHEKVEKDRRKTHSQG